MSASPGDPAREQLQHVDERLKPAPQGSRRRCVQSRVQSRNESIVASDLLVPLTGKALQDEEIGAFIVVA
ncbi:hypothetical protein LTR33_004682, partial [Friedmanniomyces endolithicus]